MIANELSSMSDKTLSINQIKGSILNYRRTYGTGSTTDIIIKADPNETTNKGYVPMFAESDVLSHGLWDASAGKPIHLLMTRCLAKVSVVVKSGIISSPEFVDGDKLEIQSASIGRMVQFNYVANLGLEYNAAFTNSSTVNFTRPITITTTSATNLSTDKLTFYIPEYIITPLFLQNKQFCYLQVNALYTQVSGQSLQTSFRIPLGDGINKLYSTPSVDINQLTTKDLSISRNTHYNFEATTNTIGSLVALKINATIKNWDKVVDVDGDIIAPKLNISTLVSKMTDDKVRIYFWSNRSDVFIEPQGRKNSDMCQVNDLFKSISAAAGVSTSNFKIFQSTDNQHFPFNGYVELEFKDTALYTGSSDVYTLIFRTGKLTRSLTVEANPVIGQINFDINNGIITGGANQFLKDIRLSEIGLNHTLVGSIISLNDPKNNVLRPGKTFAGWTYSRNGSNKVVVAADGKLQVTMAKYTTAIYALWQ